MKQSRAEVTELCDSDFLLLLGWADGARIFKLEEAEEWSEDWKESTEREGQRVHKRDVRWIFAVYLESSVWHTWAGISHRGSVSSVRLVFLCTALVFFWFCHDQKIFSQLWIQFDPQFIRSCLVCDFSSMYFLFCCVRKWNNVKVFQQFISIV